MSEDGPPGQAGDFFTLVGALRTFKAGPLGGHPSDRNLAEAADVSATTIGEWLRGSRFPQAPGKILTVVQMVRDAAARRGITSPVDGPAGLLEEACWREAYRAEAERRAGVVSSAVQRGQAARALAPPPAGWPLAEVRDPFALEVHRPVQPEDAPPRLPALPPYMPRGHDQMLGQVVRAAADGRSGIAVLVGGSSTGKTRACWEGLHLLRDQDPPWRLWHPIDPGRPAAALRDLPGIGPRTVVWLNEAQFYLEVADGGLGEQVAAGLRELLRDPGRAPVLVLATLWPQFWDTLTTRPASGDDRHAHARDLLVGHDIAVPAALTPAQVRQLTGADDPRLALAATAAKEDGQVIQFLAGAPELLARYRYAPPAARALISAAMDARRLGAGAGLPQAFLEAAAPGYLTDAEWDGLSEDWLERALAYAAVPCKGARGPLTRIRPRPASRTARGRGDQPTSTAGAAGPLYRLADYLDQHGRAHRAYQIPPAEFWSAAAAHAAPGDQAALGDAAHARGLYRDAAQLHKNAVTTGNICSVLYLSHPWACLYADPRPRLWAAAHAALDDPYVVAILLDGLLDRLRAAGAHEQAAALVLAGRAAPHAAVGDPGRVGRLLDSLRAAGAHQQAAALAARAAAHAALDDPGRVASLLDSLRAAGARQQAAKLLARDPAAHAALDDPAGVASLLDSLRAARARQQAAALAARAAAHAPLDDPGRVASLLDSLRAAGARQQAAKLLARDPAAHAALDDPAGVASLLDSLRAAGAHEQAAALAARAAAHAPLDDPDSVDRLLDALRETGADEQAAALAGRAVAHAHLDDPDAVDRLLGSLRRAGVHEQLAALAWQAVAHAHLDDPDSVDGLLDRLRAAGARQQAATLLARDPAAHAALDDPAGVASLLDSLRAAGAHEQAAALAARAAAHAPLDDPGRVASLLDRLRAAGAHQQAATLLARDPAARVALDEPRAVAVLLDRLQDAGAHQQAATLLARDPAAHVALDDLADVDRLLDSLRAAGAHEQAAALAGRAAAHAPLDDPHAVNRLLNGLRAAGAHEQAAVLTDRLPTAGMFELFCDQEDHYSRFRFGRETDGRPAEPWDWDDLDLCLFLDRGDRVGLSPTRRIRKVSLDSILSGRPELHCEAHVSSPAPHSLRPDWTGVSFPG